MLTLLVVPLYMFSPTELAPNEDQGIVFGAIDVPPNATLEQIVPYTEQIEKTFESVPEFDHSFQITFPTGGFGGAIMKPWEERKRTHLRHPGRGEPASSPASPACARRSFLPSALPSGGVRSPSSS